MIGNFGFIVVVMLSIFVGLCLGSKISGAKKSIVRISVNIGVVIIITLMVVVQVQVLWPYLIFGSCLLIQLRNIRM